MTSILRATNEMLLSQPLLLLHEKYESYAFQSSDGMSGLQGQPPLPNGNADTKR